MSIALIVILSLILTAAAALIVWHVVGLITLITFLGKKSVDFHYREEEEE